MMHAIGRALAPDADCWYTPFYCDGFLERLRRLGFLEMTVMGGQQRRRTDDYLAREGLPLDPQGESRDYDLVVTCSDLLIQKNIRKRRVILVQEGMTDPETFAYYFVRWLGLPRWIASTSTSGLSLAYDRFCVASAGYREFFLQRGVPEGLLAVTGIPNYDNCAAFLTNDFPYRNYVLVATSDMRETLKWDNRPGFLKRVRRLADDRPVLFKLHPNENFTRATREIRKLFANAPIFYDGNTNHMIANCNVLVTQYSTVVYVGLALGKECHSYFDMSLLRSLVPWQNGGTSATRIANVCRDVLEKGAAQ